VADLVVAQDGGAVVAGGPVRPATVAGRRPHGWVARPASAAGGAADALAGRRWCLGAALLVGLGRGMLELTVEHAKGRHQFGRPIGSFQAVQFRLAECLQLLESAERSTIDAAWRASTGKPHATSSAALAWLWAEEASGRVARHCHQVYGALGFCDETGVIRLSIDAIWLRTSIGRRSAARWIIAHRQRGPEVPASVVLGGFRDAG
jgi:alkylation response protein AidB-like acyl-CoA dehydrogenase